MPYITGILSIERVIRPQAVEDLLVLIPDDGRKQIVFDLELSLKREGLCAFIKECQAAKANPTLEANGGIKIPAAMENRFEFYKEFYGLTRWIALGIEILQTPDKKDDARNEDGGSDGVKKIAPTEEKPPQVKKPKPKTFKKLEARPFNIVPSSIVWIAEAGLKRDGIKGTKTTGPLPLSVKLGGHKVGLSTYALGMPAAGLKSLGGMGGLRR